MKDVDKNKDVKSVTGINIVEVANEENISEKKKENKVNKKNYEIDVVDLAKENVLSKVADELAVRKMILPSGIYSSWSTQVGIESVENKNKFVEVENNENAIDNFKFLGEFQAKGEVDIEYIFDKEKSESNVTDTELDRNQIKKWKPPVL